MMLRARRNKIEKITFVLFVRTKQNVSNFQFEFLVHRIERNYLDSAVMHIDLAESRSCFYHAEMNKQTVSNSRSKKKT